jgi:hypothetical protein
MRYKRIHMRRFRRKYRRWFRHDCLLLQDFLAFVCGDDDDDDDDDKRKDERAKNKFGVAKRNTRKPHPLRNTAWHELALHLDEIRTESRPSLCVFVLAPNFVPELTHSNIHPFWAKSFPTQTQAGGSSVVRLSVRL